MPLEELIVLLPCHSLEDFPLYHEGEAAEGLLAAWSALWHPALLVAAGKTPTWRRADDPPEELAQRLLVVPSVVQSELPAGFAARAKTEAAGLIRKLHKRDEIVAAALEGVGGDAGIEHNVSRDFLALGLCFLWTELLTRRMRHSSNLDQAHFQKQALAAAQAALKHEPAAVREHLSQCFDALAEVRSHYYGVDAYLVDLTLVAPTTIGASLRKELATGVINLLLSGEVLEQIAREEPETLAAIRSALDEGRAGLVGGEFSEEDLPLMTPNAILEQLQRGLATYEKHLGRRPQVFGRRRFGLTPVLPQLLSKLGFRGAMHLTLDDGQFPAGERSKTRWEGADGTALDAMGRVPLDATQPGGFLGLPERLGESMDLDMVATVCFAHWPGQFSTFYEDLRRMAAYTPVLGKFVTVEDYFSNTASSGLLSRFEADRYRSPYLQQAIIRRQSDPLSQSVKRLSEEAKRDAWQTLGAVAELLTGTPAPARIRENDDATRVQEAAKSLAKAMARGGATAGSPGAGELLLNPLSFARRIGGTEVPGMGFAWTAAADGGAASGKSLVKAGEHLLRNDFCEVLISKESGGIQSIHDYRSRGNRFSQQIGLRLPSPRRPADSHSRDPDEDALYAAMVADGIEVAAADAGTGAILSHGRLVDEQGRRLAGFKQWTRLSLGSPVIEIEIELDPAEELRADPWNSYFAARFAWPDAGAELRRGVNLGAHPTNNKRLEAPHFIEVGSESLKTTILTGGLPYHLRMGMRMLDSLLIVRGETARRFRLGIGLDLPNPAAAALEFLAPRIVVGDVPAPASPTGWLFHVDNRSVIATDWAPLVAEGRVTGFRVRLLETQGKGTKAALRCFKAPASARQTDFLGQPLGVLAVEKDQIALRFSGHECIQLEATW